MRRTYLFFMLIVYGITGIISLPLAIYQTIDYHIADTPLYGRPHSNEPSTELAIAIVIVILWAYFMFRVLREVRQRDSGELEG